MKTLRCCYLSLLMVLTGLSVHSQSPGISITNFSACTVYFQLIGGADPATPCTPTTFSGIIQMLPSGGAVVYANPTTVPIPGLSPTNCIVGARIYSQYPATCPPQLPTYVIGDICTPFLQSQVYISVNLNCSTSCNVTAVWTPGSTLNFY